MRHLSTILAAPALCFALLAGITVEKSRRISPVTAEPYHERARLAVESLPRLIYGWSGTDVPLPPEAVKLLKPNAVLCRRYEDAGNASLRSRDRWGDLLIVQCRESRDMVGHYPKNCYPSNGWIEQSATPFDGSVGDLKISATEYQFSKTKQGQTKRQCVYNFLIVPGLGIVPDIKGVEQAAEDYQQRYFGAAQYQVIVDGDLPREEREEIYRILIRANIETIKTLENLGAQS